MFMIHFEIIDVTYELRLQIINLPFIIMYSATSINHQEVIQNQTPKRDAPDGDHLNNSNQSNESFSDHPFNIIKEEFDPYKNSTCIKLEIGNVNQLSYEATELKEEPCDEWLKNEENVILISCMDTSQLENDLKNNGLGIKQEIYTLDSNHKISELEIKEFESASDAIFTKKVNLKKHTEVHEDRRELDLLCSTDMNDLGENPQYRCVCDHNFSFAKCYNSVKQHFCSCKERKSVFCSICNQSFMENRYLQIHLKIHESDAHYACSLCNDIFSDANSLKSHIVVHKYTRPFLCSICHRLFIRKTDLNKHEMAHKSGNLMYTCSHCKGSFKYKCSLIRHKIVHTNQKPFTCAVCMRAFSRKLILRNHIESIHIKKLFSCSICGRTFNEILSLKKHMTFHEESINLRSLNCRENFKKLIEKDEKRSLCPICNQSFAQKSNLKRHITIHFDDRPFSCSMCNRSFTQKGDLTRHNMIHKNEKPFVCNICNHSFVQKCSLKRHMMVHTKEKPFACCICLLAFSRKHLLKSHMISIHKLKEGLTNVVSENEEKQNHDHF